MSPPTTYADSPRFTSSQGLEPGLTSCVVPDGQMIGQSGRRHAPANLSARQAKEKGLMMSGTYGPPCIGWSGSADLSLLLASNLRVLTEASGSTLYKLTWKDWVMPSGRVRFRLRASVRRTSATGLIGWPTPTANAWKHPSNAGREGGLNLQTAAALAGWTTPSASDSRRGGTGITEGMSGSSLAQLDQMAGWPTPTASDHKGGLSGWQDSQRKTINGSAGCGGANNRPGPVNGYWRDSDWVYCRDGKWRPVEPQLRPLVNGATARVGKIRAYGNAINVEAATAFIKAYIATVSYV